MEILEKQKNKIKKNLPPVVLAAGEGIRLLPYTANLPKVLLEINGRPLISYVLETTKVFNSKEIFIVVGFQKQLVKEYVNANFRGLNITYIEQKKRVGLVNAISLLEPYLDEDFILMLGDEIYINTRHNELLPFYYKNNPDVVCGIMKTDDPSLIKKNYSVEIKNGKIIRLIEKPEIVINNIMGSGTCIFKPTVFDYIKRTPINPKRKQKELTDLIQEMIKDNKMVLPFDLGGDYVNINYFDDLKKAEIILKGKCQ